MSRRRRQNPPGPKIVDVVNELPKLRTRAERAVARLRDTRARMRAFDAEVAGQPPRIGSVAGPGDARDVAVRDVIIQALSIPDSEVVEYRVVDVDSDTVIVTALPSFSAAYDEAVRLTSSSNGRIWQESRDKRGRMMGHRTLVPSRR